jgi:hypothetical protein
MPGFVSELVRGIELLCYELRLPNTIDVVR